MFPDEIKQFIEKWLSAEISTDSRIIEVNTLSGGSIHEAFSILTPSGKYFLKYNVSGRYPNMFSAEAKGLDILKKTLCIDVPHVFLTTETGRFTFILEEFVESGKPHQDFYAIFGQQLAALHTHSSETFGLDHHNYIGTISQANNQHGTWLDFMINERLFPLLKIAVDQGKLNMTDSRKFHSLFNYLPEIIPLEKPALLHGDLWSGNYLSGKQGLPCIFDPAVYFGHREMDIAMTRLFGGFSANFYESYNTFFPLEPGWKNRTSIFQLYPLLVHAILFGGSYTAEIRQTIGKF